MTEWWQFLLVAIIPSIVTLISTLIVLRKTHLTKNSDCIGELAKEIVKINEYLGLKEKRTLNEQLGLEPKDGSLTSQHYILHNLLCKEIDIVEKRNNDYESRLRNFTQKQVNLNDSFEQLKLLVEDWQKTNKLNIELQDKIFILEDEKLELKKKISSIENASKNQSRPFQM